jgi:hypothetical protein
MFYSPTSSLIDQFISRENSSFDSLSSSSSIEGGRMKFLLSERGKMRMKDGGMEDC